MLTPDYPLTTERLLLRPLDAATDVDAVHAYASDPQVCRYIPWVPRDRDAVAEWIAKDRGRSSLTEEGQSMALAIVVRETGTLVGDVILFWRSTEHRHAEIGYVLNPAHSGRGYATEAAGALLRLAFVDLKMHRVTATLDTRNPASAAVLERLGMRREAHRLQDEWFKGEWTDSYEYAILADEWRARTSGES